jgi:hypothetical protein
MQRVDQRDASYRYSHDLHRMNPDVLIDQFQELKRKRAEVERVICRGVDDARRAPDEPYELLLATI